MNLDKQAIEQLLANDLCVIMQGETDQAFRQKEFDGEKWSPRKEEDGIGSLMIHSGALRRSIIVEADGNQVTIRSNMLYANIHNLGGVINVPISDKMRKYFWAMYHKKKLTKWKALALTKKKQLTIRIPRRQFAGITRQTERKWQEAVDLRLKHLNIIGAIKAEIK